MKKQELMDVLTAHKKWLRGEESGVRADLRGANLYRADLSGADLSGADLSGADLSGADLRVADLRGSDLRVADLSGADLRVANLYRADLSGADLSGADLSGADLSGANLYRAKTNAHTAFFALQCPEKGAYTAFKVANGLIIELEIPADAKRSSSTSRKCRASKARVISITDIDGNAASKSVPSSYDDSFIYAVGETVEVPNFDEDRWHEYAPGIHHFITRAEAVAHE